MTPEQTKSGSVYQLRIYEVAPDLRDVFHRRFKNHALRIMQRYGFEMMAMWESTSVVDFEFACMLRWPDEETMERQWQLFLTDTEWIEIKIRTVSETGEPVQRVSSRVLDEVVYCPV